MIETKKMQQIGPPIFCQQMQSPVGVLTLLASSNHLQAVIWENGLKDKKISSYISSLLMKGNHITTNTIQQLEDYFSGKRQTFNIPLRFIGTSFQKKSWEILLSIPYGQTLSYGEQAMRFGDKNKARAIGAANGKNPLSIIVPCHRVVGKNGKLTGFAGGLEKKQFLLDLEAKNDIVLS